MGIIITACIPRIFEYIFKSLGQVSINGLETVFNTHKLNLKAGFLSKFIRLENNQNYSLINSLPFIASRDIKRSVAGH